MMNSKKDYSYIVPPHVVDELNPIRRQPIKLPSLPTVAHNYTFWGDLIFKPKSREEGMLLMVEGTSRWCWCHPFHHKGCSNNSRDSGEVH